MQLDRVDVEAVGPGRHTHFWECTPEEDWIPQRCDHWPWLCDEIAEIVLAGTPIGESDAQPVAAYRLYFNDLDDGECHTSAPGTCSNGNFCRPRSQFCMRSLRRATTHSRISFSTFAGRWPPITVPVSIANRASKPP